jgi:hypothetical protein
MTTYQKPVDLQTLRPIKPPTSYALLWRDWTLACALGELIGIGLSAAAAVYIILRIGETINDSERLFVLSTMTAVGIVEGAAVGYFQWRILRHVFPTLLRAKWVGVTIAVAVAGWVGGMTPSIFFAPSAAQEPFDPSLALTIGMALVAGIGAGTAFGVAQWVILRKHARRAYLWIIGNAVGWGVALMWIFGAAALPTPDSSAATITVIGVLAGILAGLSVGAITGGSLLLITRASAEKTANI